MEINTLKDIFKYLVRDESTCISSNYSMDENGVVSMPHNPHIHSFTFETADKYQLDEVKDDIEDDIKYGYLGLCGCYVPEIGLVAALKLLGYFELKDKYDYKDNIKLYKEKEYEYIKKYFGFEFSYQMFRDEFQVFSLYQLDELGLIDHGSNITCSWLTDKGRIVLKFYEGKLDNLIIEINDYFNNA